MHALLFRKGKNRVKGRDWFDLEWYIRRGTLLHLEHLKKRALDSGDWSGKTFTKEDLMHLLGSKIDSVSFNRIKEDIVKFIPDSRVLDIWSPAYFREMLKQIRII